MDPLSIVSAVTGIAAVSMRTAMGLESLHGRCQNAHLTITAFSSQCTAIKTGLHQLHGLILRNKMIRERVDVVMNLDTTLTGCNVVLSCLESTVDKLCAADAGPTPSIISRWRNKASIVWNEAEMKGYLSLLQGQQVAVGFLI